MITFHAVMIDETGCEFGAEVEANNHDEAHDLLSERCPESRVDQLESPQDRAEREHATYVRAMRELDGDEPYDYDEDF